MTLKRKWMSLALIIIMISTSFSSVFGAEYYDYQNYTGVKSFSTYYDMLPVWDDGSTTIEPYWNGYGWGHYKKAQAYYKPAIGFDIHWTNVESYSFDGSKWIDNGNAPRRLFYIREDYYDKAYTAGVEMTLPKSVNVMFMLIKEKGVTTPKLYQYKLSTRELEYIYKPYKIPTWIISITDQIDALPTLANYTTSHKAIVENVQKAYNALSDYDKKYVYNYSKLYALMDKINKETTSTIDWTKVYPDLLNQPGKLTEQYYNVSAYGLNHSVYQPVPQKNKIFEKPIGTARINNATVTTNILNDTTDKSSSVFFTYEFSSKREWSKSMAKKVWGYFIAPETGKYRFRIKSDDGHDFRMYLGDGKTVNSNVFTTMDATTSINSEFNLHNISSFDSSGTFDLKAGVPYPIYIEYFNHGGNAALVMQYMTERTTTWTQLSGNVFKPSSSSIFNQNIIVTSDLELLLKKAELLLSEYLNKQNVPPAPLLQGQIDQTIYDQLNTQYKASLALFNTAQTQTQTAVNQSADALKKMLETFEANIAKISKALNTIELAQNGSTLNVKFDKDASVVGYKIILSDQKIDSNNKTAVIAAGSAVGGKTLTLLNTQAVLGLDETQKSFDFAGGQSTLVKATGKDAGVFNLNIDLVANGFVSKDQVNVYVQTYNTSVYQESLSSPFVSDSEVIIKAPKRFDYYDDASAKQVTFYTDAVSDYGFVLIYTDVNNVSQTVFFPSNSTSHSISTDLIDVAKISSAKLALVEPVSNDKPQADRGIGQWLTGPKKIETPKVSDLVLKLVNGMYSLEWKATDKAISYVVYKGNSSDTSKMVAVTEPTTQLSYSIPVTVGFDQYFSVKANLMNSVTNETLFADPVHVVKAGDVEILNYVSGKARQLVPTRETYFVLKGDGKSYGGYEVVIPSSVSMKAYSTNVSGGAELLSLDVAFPETANTPNEKVEVNKSPLIPTVTVDEATKMSTYYIPAAGENIVIALTAAKNQLKDPFASTLSVKRKLIDSKQVFIGESNSKVVDLSMMPNEKEVKTTLTSGSTGKDGLEIANGVAKSTFAESMYKFTFEFNKGDAYRPIIEFVLLENEYMELISSKFAVEKGTLGGNATKVNAFINVQDHSTIANARKVSIVLPEGLNYKDSFVTVSIQLKPKARDNISSSPIYNKETGIALDKIWKMPLQIANLLKPGVAKPDKSKPDAIVASDYLTYGLGIVTRVHFDDVSNNTSIDGSRTITEDSLELKIQLKNMTELKSSF